MAKKQPKNRVIYLFIRCISGSGVARQSESCRS